MTNGATQEVEGDTNLNSNYSAFFPVLIVFTALTIMFGIQFSNTLEQRKQLNSQLTEYKKDLPKAQLINNNLLAVSRDLLALEPNDPAARQIVKDFRIQMGSPPAKEQAGNK